MTNRPTPGGVALTSRAHMPVVSDMHAAYSLDVDDGQRRVDRAEWAALIRELMTAETKGRKEPFARVIGVNSRTITRWLDRDVDVSEGSVRLVARTLGRQPMDLLIRVGYYRQADLLPQPVPRGAEDDDHVVERIQAADLPPAEKRRMLERLRKLRADQRARELDEVGWWIDSAAGR